MNNKQGQQQMTVRELMKRLEKLDPNMRVVVDGCEYGYEDVQDTQIKDFWIGGYYSDVHDVANKHEWIDDEYQKNGTLKETAFLISRR